MKNADYGSWKTARPTAVILAFFGLLTGSIEFFVAATIPLTILLISYISREPESDNIKVVRVIEDKAPRPGEQVEITLKVRNEGERTATDIRVIDTVPEELNVVEGSPRGSFAVSPRSERELNYAVMTKRGTHVFDEVNVEFRGGGHDAVIKEVSVEGDEQIDCKTELNEISLREKTEEQVGDIVKSRGGNGLEFHSLRDYKNSDPPSRVEWKHLAKTGELATKNFKEERLGEIVLVIDSRPVSNRRAEKGHPTGSDLSSYTAKRFYKALLKSRHRPGIAILGVDNSDIESTTDSNIMPYVKPGRTTEKQTKVKEVLQQAQQAEKRDLKDLESKLYRLLPPSSQIVFFTPLLDDEITSTLKILDRHGFPSTVISPDVVYGDDGSSRIANIERDLRIKEVRGLAPVIDWSIDKPISMQVSKALRMMYKREM